MSDDEEPGHIPAKPRVYNDDELQIIQQQSFENLQKKNDPVKTKVTITTKKPNASPKHQIVFPLPRIPTRSTLSSDAVIRHSESNVSESASESGYSSAQTQKMGSTKPSLIRQSDSMSESEHGYCSAQTQKMGSTTATRAKSPKAKPPKAGKKKKKSQTTTPVMTRAILDLIKDGVQHYHDGEYANAMKSFKSVLKSQMIRRAQTDNPLVANMLANIGTIYLRLDRYDHAIESLEKAERMMRRSKTKHKKSDQQIVQTDIPLAWVLNNLATAKCLREEHKASLECYWEAIKVARAHDGESSKRETANALYNVGRIGVLRKDSEMAMFALTKSLELETKLCGPKSIQIVDTLNLIGFVHYQKGEFERAISVFTEGLSIVTATYGSVHEKVAVSLTNVGMVLEKEGDLAEALRCFSTARDVCEKAGLGEGNSTMKTSIRSANDMRRKLSLVQDVAPSIQKKESMESIQRKESMESRHDQEEPKIDRPSFDQIRKKFGAQDREGPSIQKKEIIESRHDHEEPKIDRPSFHQIRKTFAAQNREGPSIQKKESVESRQDQEEPKIDRPSFDQMKKNSAAHDESKQTIERWETRRRKKIDMEKIATSIEQKKPVPSSTPTINVDNTPKNIDPNATVRTVGKKVDVPTYAAFRNRLKADQNTIVEYREDLSWEYDNASMVEEDRLDTVSL